MGAFDDILDDLKVEAGDREVILPFVKKYPDLESAVIRRSEYNRKLDEMDREKTTRAKDFEELESWRNVTKEHWDPEAKNWKEVAFLENQLTAEKQRASDLQKLVEAGGEMNFDDVLKGLNDKGYVTKTDLTPFMPKTEYEADVNKRLGTHAASTEYIFGKVAPYLTKYNREFNDDMPMEDFMKFATANDLWKDPQKAYEQFTAGKRQQLEFDRLNKEVEAAEQRGYEKAKAEKQATHQPDDTSGNNPQTMGPLQMRLKQQKEGNKEPVLNGKLGDGSAAAAGMEALRNGTLVAP